MDAAVGAVMLGWVGVACGGLYVVRGDFAEFLEVLWTPPILTRTFLSPLTFCVLPGAALIAFVGVCAGIRRALPALIITSVAVVPFFLLFLVAMYLPIFLQEGAGAQ